MRNPPRICFIGGGSYQWARTLVRDILVHPDLDGCQITIEDIDPEPLAVLLPLARRMAEAAGREVRLRATTDLAEALAGADYVILSITTGGLEAMRNDLEIPERYGIFQSVGDTVGPGGLARALRNIPVVVEIARTIERCAPDATLLNLTNPMTTLCRAVTRTTSVPTIGLCHELIGAVRSFVAPLLGVEDLNRFHVQVAGVNHLIWILDLRLDGKDALALLRERLDRIEHDGADAETASILRAHAIKIALWERYGALPAAGDRHLIEFFPFFLKPETARGPYSGVHLTSIAERYEWLARWKSRANAWLDGSEPVDLQPSSEPIAPIIAALHYGGARVQVMNLPNSGQIPRLPAGAVLETMGVVDGLGARPFAVGELPTAIHSILERHVANQELIVEAALTGDRALALEALVNDPQVLDFDLAPRLLADLLAANERVAGSGYR
jgi:alpha-galactosidase/6-phospho-beta-glucosidase family protein